QPLDRPDEGSHALRALRDKLGFGRNDAFVIRRTKDTHVEGLPAKHEHVVPCDLGDEQRSWHLNIVSDVKNARSAPLKALQELVRLYQHPGLLPNYSPMTPAEAIARSSKLGAALRVLEDVRGRHEKCLIFTRTIDMQQLLASVVGSHFHLDVEIVNGTTQRRSTASQRGTRAEILANFGRVDGFNVIVLSPDVAGVGLTIVDANHVIHYGRWWNPAKEMQATDRVYRLGQTRDVHVYFPVTVDPLGQFETFDQKL